LSDQLGNSQGQGLGGAEAKSAATSVVVQTLTAVKPEDVDYLLRARESEEHAARLRTVLASWEVQQKQERELRRWCARLLVQLMGLELLAIFVAFFLMAAGKLDPPRWTAEGFLLAAFGQSTGLVLVVVKYLFPDRSPDVLRLLLAIGPGRSTAEKSGGA
jgi:hypothetical protein